MAREISIHEVADDVLRDELLFFIQYFRVLGHEQCEVLFGWHWGMNYYPTALWERLHFRLAELEAEVRKAEDAGFGQFGHDDLFVKVPPLDCEFWFCHHAGIHLSFGQPGQVTADFFERWHLAGFAPIERDCTSEP